ncbi:MAG: hypothetical protein U9R17_12045 [Thermodesulfobacteriota bacterium]|nr:hypothetical protein [Thermodesulfobacteriota bacterium]
MKMPGLIDVLCSSIYGYSDGIIEGFDGHKKTRSQGIKELSDACFDTRQISVRDAVEKIGISFSLKDDPQDDIVLLGVEV